jgi:hypothetical protein
MPTLIDLPLSPCARESRRRPALMRALTYLFLRSCCMVFRVFLVLANAHSISRYALYRLVASYTSQRYATLVSRSLKHIRLEGSDVAGSFLQDARHLKNQYTIHRSKA